MTMTRNPLLRSQASLKSSRYHARGGPAVRKSGNADNETAIEGSKMRERAAVIRRQLTERKKERKRERERECVCMVVTGGGGGIGTLVNINTRASG